MKFIKMHGCGNDYIYVDCTKEDLVNESELSIKLSDRRFGIGSDGLILIRNSDVADFKMSIFNADGSEAKMCGNGVRCVGKFVYDNGLTDKEEVRIETLSGIKILKLNIREGKVVTVEVDMGAPIVKAEMIPAISSKGSNEIIDEEINVDGVTYKVTCISMGNPHCVTFVDDTKILDLEKIGPGFERHKMFPDRVNTEFIQVLSRNEINMRVWERGSGETFACGTGACASVVACVLNGLTDDAVKVNLVGGELFINYDRKADTVFMTGPATTVYSGEVEL
jgi:diaminopimelate epimerase